MSEYTCVSCGDTGINSKGGICTPCHRQGRQPLKRAVLGALKQVFAECHEMGRLPDPCELRSAIDWAYAPRVLYAAGYRDKDGGMAYFSGASVDQKSVFVTPPELSDPRPAFVVALIKDDHYKEEPILEPIARWNGAKWVTRPSG